MPLFIVLANTSGVKCMQVAGCMLAMTKCTVCQIGINFLFFHLTTFASCASCSSFLHLLTSSINLIYIYIYIYTKTLCRLGLHMVVDSPRLGMKNLTEIWSLGNRDL